MEEDARLERALHTLQTAVLVTSGTFLLQVQNIREVKRYLYLATYPRPTIWTTLLFNPRHRLSPP